MVFIGQVFRGFVEIGGRYVSAYIYTYNVHIHMYGVFGNKPTYNRSRVAALCILCAVTQLNRKPGGVHCAYIIIMINHT